MIQFFIIILIYLIYLFYINIHISIENNKLSNNLFIEKDKFIKILLTNEYFKTLSELDLFYRKSKSKISYLYKYINSIVEINDAEKKYLNTLYNNVYKILPDKLRKIKFKIAKIKFDKTVENGYPHTLENIIIINDDFYKRDQINTLIHEIVHIYQREYPNETDDYLSLINYYKLDIEKNNNLFINKFLNKQASNPDCRLNTHYYIIKNNKKKLIRTIYNSKFFGGDVSNIIIDMENGKIENIHIQDKIKYEGQPNEVMAEIIARVITNKIYDEKTLKWLNGVN